MGYVYSDMISNQFLPDTFRDAIDKLSKTSKKATSLSEEKIEFIERGNVYLEEGDYEGAINYFNAMKNHDLLKDDYHIYLKLAEAYHKSMLYEEEIRVIVEFFRSGVYCSKIELELFKDRLKILDEMGYFDYNVHIDGLEREFFIKTLLE